MKHLTKEQKQYIIKNFRKMPFSSIANNLNVSYSKVYYFCKQRGLKRTDKEKSNIYRIRGKKKIRRLVQNNVPHYKKRNYQLHEWI